MSLDSGFNPGAMGKVVALLLQVGDVLEVGRVLEVLQEGMGLAVQGLPRDIALLGVMRDGAVVAEEDDAGAGEAVLGSYDTHG